MHLLRRVFGVFKTGYKLIIITNTNEHKQVLIFLFVICSLFGRNTALRE